MSGGARRPIFLLGFPGSGKTTLGKALRKAAGISFVDLDHAIEEDAHMSVPQIFATEGEAGFRRRESDMLRSLATKGIDVIALGGGTPCQPGNMDVINSLGTSVWLEAGRECLFRRLKLGRAKRPLIAALDDTALIIYIDKTMAERSPHYARAAHRFNAERLENAVQINETVTEFRKQFGL